MPYVTCPTCGERGKIPPNLVGARIKCRKCGLSFMVAAAGRQGRCRGECLGDVVGQPDRALGGCRAAPGGNRGGRARRFFVGVTDRDGRAAEDGWP